MTQIYQTKFIAQDAAARIIEELEIRGLTAETPINSEEFANKITNIILETMRGNTNYCVTTASEDDCLESLQRSELSRAEVQSILDELARESAQAQDAYDLPCPTCNAMRAFRQPLEN